MNLILLHNDDFIADDRVRLSGRRREHVLEVHRAAVGDSLRVGKIDAQMGTSTVITLTGDNPLLIEAGNPFVDPGATATDTVDDDATLTANIVVDDSAVDILTPGDYPVTYDVTDSEGNAADTVTRTVTITPDVTPPVITLLGNNPQVIPLNSP